MRRSTILLLAIPVLALTACADSTRSADGSGLRAERPDAAILAPCPRPVPIPSTARTQGAQEALWRRDRIHLAECGDRHGALAVWARDVTDTLTEE